MSIFSLTLTFLCYYPISDLTHSSVTCVIFMFSCSRPSHPWCHVPFHSHTSSLLSNFRPHTTFVTSVMSMFTFTLTFLIIKFPISHTLHDIRDVNAQFHTNSSPLWSNLPSPQCVAESWHIDIKFQISAGRRRIMTHEHQISDLRRASQDHDVNTKFPHQSFRSPQCVAGSHSIV